MTGDPVENFSGSDPQRQVEKVWTGSPVPYQEESYGHGKPDPAGVYLNLFAATEVFIYVFIEIVTKLDSVRRVIFKKAGRNDYIIFIVIFGLFSIFGTYLGIPERSGAITNIRDLAPMVAGFVAGPYVGVAVGLIGGSTGTPWRCLLRPCSLATVLAGLLAGLVYHSGTGDPGYHLRNALRGRNRDSSMVPWHWP